MQDDKLLKEKEAAEFLGLSAGYLNCLRCASKGPPFVKLGRAVRYRPDDLHRWVEDRVCTPKLAV